MNMKNMLIAAFAALLLASCGSSAPQSPMAAWENGAGGSHLKAVVHDVLALGGDGQDISALTADGNSLAGDATLAENSAPPLASAQARVGYILAMTLYHEAGQDIAAGNYTSAATEITNATDDIKLVQQLSGEALNGALRGTS